VERISVLRGDRAHLTNSDRVAGGDPPLIPDLLALVGDAANGYPGIPGIGPRTAAQLLIRYGRIENFPPHILGRPRKLALLFKKLATLRTNAPLFKNA
jgi:5'-3' exonuclease